MNEVIIHNINFYGENDPMQNYQVLLLITSLVIMMSEYLG